MSIRLLIVFVFFCQAINSTTSFAQASSFAIENVSVIPMNEDKVLSNYTILINNGKITKIGPATKIKTDGYTKIDGTNKYLMPGLFDMHAHFFADQGDHKNTIETELKLMLANGITTARIMTGHPIYLEARSNVKNQKWIGPELKVASPQLAGKWPWPTDFKNFELVTTPAMAEKAVTGFKDLGYDAIKITFMVEPEVFQAIVKQAAKEKIQVVGHVGPLVKLPAALAAGEQIEHMDMFIEMLLPDTSYNHGQSVSDYNIYSKAAWATVPHLQEQKIPALTRSVKEAGIYVTPTNYFFISNAGLPLIDEAIKQMPDYNYIPPALKEEKWKYREKYLQTMAPLESREKYVSLRKKMVYALWKEGVPLMAGSDSPEYFIVAGFSIHDELSAMVDAGLSPYAALQTATSNPATFMNMNNRTGTIEVGKEADLILLDQNPLEDIQNTRTISGVFNQSKWYDQRRLNQLLEEAKVLGK